MRNLCTIVTISKVEAIPDKDRIQFISMKENAYQIIGDSSYKVGDLAIYIEVDTLLPIKPEFEFLRERCYKSQFDKFLIKAMKMCDKVSNGILFPTSILPPAIQKKVKTGMDVTSVIGAIKLEDIDDSASNDSFFIAWIKKSPLLSKIFKVQNQKKTGAFPIHLIDKSDEDNIMNCPELLEENKDKLVYASIKMEGQSATFYVDYTQNKAGQLIACSKNQMFRVHNGKDPVNNELFFFAQNSDLKNKLIRHYKETGENLIIQGEICRSGVQKNIYHFETTQFFIFGIKNMVNGEFLDVQSMQNFALQNTLTTVPIVVEQKILKDILPNIDACQEFGTRYFQLSSDKKSLVLDYKLTAGEKVNFKTVFLHEGVVVRSHDNKTSFKIKNDQYKIWFGKWDC